MTESLPSPEELFHQAGALRRIALAVVGDDAAADDVVQGVLLNALQREEPPSPGWMARLARSRAVDFLRRRRTRDEREARAAEEPQASPGPADIAERMESYRLLTEVVASLGESYQEVVYLRYYEGLTPTRISARLGVPLKTVKTRLHRALAKMRERLRAVYGSEPDALRGGLLVPLGLAGRRASSGAPWLPLAGIGLMTKALSVTLALVLALTVFYFLSGDDTGPASVDVVDAGGGESVAVVAPADLVPEPDVARDAEDEGRQAAAAEPVAPEPPATDTAALLVRMRHEDGRPAAGREVYVTPEDRGGEWACVARGRTDERGEVLLTGLVPQAVRVGPLREHHEHVRKVSLETGERAQVEVVLPDGVRVRGVVRDPEGRPVAGAALWVATGMLSWAGGELVGTSGERGEFALDGVDPGAGIGALLAGYRRSELVDLDLVPRNGTGEVEIEVVLRAGGASVTGVVVDEAGEPVAGAWVSAGKALRHFDWHQGGEDRVDEWTPITTRTDEEGRFAVHGFPRSSHPVEVKARGFATWKETVDLKDGSAAPLLVALERGFSVTGIVTDGEGRPVPRAVVRAFDGPVPQDFIQGGQFDEYSAFGYARVRADEHGVYALEHLRCVPTHLYATFPQRRGGAIDDSVVRAHEVVEGGPGEIVAWDPVLEEGLVLPGRVTWADGEAMGGVFVTARHETSGVRQSLVNRGDGTFRFLCMEPGTYTLSVQIWSPPPGAKPLVRRAVSPGRGEVVLAAGYNREQKGRPGTVAGTIEDVAGRLTDLDMLRVILRHREAYAWREDARLEGTSFRFEGIVPGEYRVAALSGSTQIYEGDWFTLGAEEDLDLGALRTEPGGGLVVEVDREGAEALDPKVYLVRTGSVLRQELGIGASPFRVENLCDGEYGVHAIGTGLVSVKDTVRIEAGADTRYTLRLRPGAKVPFEITLPTEGDLGYLRTILRDDAGKEHWNLKEGAAAALPRPYARWTYLPVGGYVLRAELGSGDTAEVAFTVGSLDEERAPVRLRFP